MTVEAYAPVEAPTISGLWDLLVEDRTPALCVTTLATDYRQVAKWLQRCPYQNPCEARKAAGWLLQQQPTQSARKVLMYLRLALRWACSEEIRLLDHNPLKTYTLPKAPQREEEVVVIPAAEWPLVIASCKRQRGAEGPDWSKPVELMAQGGFRTGEIFAARWEDIKDGHLLIHQNMTLTHGLKASTKTNRRRRVPLNEKALAVLDSLPRDDDFIFPAARWNRDAFQSFFRRRMETLHRSGLISRRYRPYDLRHTCLSRWLEAGVPVTQVARWAGNTPAVVWQHYANSTEEFEMPVL